MKSNNLIFIKGLLFLSFLLAVWACEDSSIIEERNYQLVWQDEFNTDGALDSTKWVYDLGAGGWGNNELQKYTSDPENVSVEDGALKITAINNGGSYTSARIKTMGKFDQAYGRFEAKIK